MAKDLEVLQEIERITGVTLNRIQQPVVQYGQITRGYILDDNGRVVTLQLDSVLLVDTSILKELSHLTFLIYRYSKAADYSFLKELKNLSYLDLSYNQIVKLPQEIVALNIDIKWHNDSMGGIYLRNNPLESPPIEIVRQGREAVKNYFAKLVALKNSGFVTQLLHWLRFR